MLLIRSARFCRYHSGCASNKSKTLLITSSNVSGCSLVACLRITGLLIASRPDRVLSAEHLVGIRCLRMLAS